MQSIQLPSGGTEIITLGHVLRAELGRRGMTQQGLADSLEMSRATVNSLINERSDVSGAIALKLANLFNRPVEFWVRASFSEADLSPAQPESGALDNSHQPGRLSNVGIKALVNAGYLEIEPFNESLVQPASIDLCVGDSIQTADRTKIEVDRQAYWLGTNETVLVTTKERLKLPIYIAGNIGGMARHAKKFILYGIGYEIDPGFEGQLGFTVTNLGSAPFRIQEGSPIITVMFYRLAERSSEGWVKADQNGSSKIKLNSSNILGDIIRLAFKESFQTTKDMRLIEHSISGTELRFRMKENLGFEGAFDLFLEEFVEINRALDVATDSDTREKLGVRYDNTWRFLEQIAITPASLIASEQRLKPLLNTCNPTYVESWKQELQEHPKAATTSIGEQSELLGVSPIRFILAVFEKLKFAK